MGTRIISLLIVTEMAPIDLTGPWVITKTTNMEAFLAEMEVPPPVIAKMASFSGKMQHCITQKGDDIIIDVSGPQGDSQEKFTVGVEQDMKMEPNGIPAKFLAVWKDNKLDCTITPVDSSKKTQRITRELANGGKEMHVLIYIGDVVCGRYFSK